MSLAETFKQTLSEVARQIEEAELARQNEETENVEPPAQPAPKDELPEDLSPSERHALEWVRYLKYALHTLDQDKTTDEQRSELGAWILTAAPLHWALCFGERFRVFPIWPTVDGKCTCNAGAGCRSPGRHPTIKGLRQAVHVNLGAHIERAALAQVIKWWADAPAAHVGLAIADGYVSVYGADLHRLKSPEESQYPANTPTFRSNETEETEMIFALESDKILPDDLGAGVRVRQPGDFTVAYAGTYNVGPGIALSVEVETFARYPAPAPDWITRFAEFAPKAVCEEDIRLATKPPPVHWLCRDLGIAPGRPTVVGGFAGGGKSPFAQALAISVATGRPFLGMPVRQERVAWCAFEAAQVAHVNLQRLARGAGVDPSAIAIDAWPFRGKLNDRGTMAELRRRVRASGHGLVVIDSYTSGLRDVEHNSSAFGDALRQLEKLSDETGAVVLVLMHTAKKAEATGSRDIAGHFSAIASAQAAVSLTRPDPDRLTRFKVSCLRSLFAPFDSFEVEFRDVHEDPVLRETPAWGLRLVRDSDDPVTDFILGLVDTSPGTNRHHIVDCARGHGYGRNETDDALKTLEESGQLRVEKTKGAGNKYWLASGGTRVA